MKQVLEINGKDIFFRIGKSKHKIGSKMFPINQKSNMQIFEKENTSEIDNDLLVNVIEMNKHLFEQGRCHRNVYILCEIGKKLNINIQHYTGWLFVGDNKPPLYHSFAVLDGNVIDTATSQRKYNIAYEINQSSNNSRNEYARKIAEFEMSDEIPFKDKITFGKVVEDIIYVGSPDDYNHANETFKNLATNFQNHISYRNYGMNMWGKSLLQKEIDKYK